ncbi:hypothetical protein SFRURICE_007310, partial [Spodoptera frugiperda]
FNSTVEAPYSRFLHSRFHYSRIEKLRPNSHIRGLRFLYSRIESKYRNVSPITPYKLPFHIHFWFLYSRHIYGTHTPRIKSFYCITLKKVMKLLWTKGKPDYLMEDASDHDHLAAVRAPAVVHTLEEHLPVHAFRQELLNIGLHVRLYQKMPLLGLACGSLLHNYAKYK